MMLVLSRKVGEGIVINDNIEVFVVQVHGDKVRLGIIAPKDIPVHRQEVHQVIHDPKTIDKPEVPEMSSLLTDLQKARSQSEHYQSMLLSYVIQEWSAVSQDEINHAMSNPMDVIELQHQSNELALPVPTNRQDLPSHFLVGWLASATRQFHDLLTKARTVSVDEQRQFQHQLNTILRALQFVPLEWSKLSHQSGSNLVVCAGMHEGISIVFGVDESRRRVVVRSIRAHEGHFLSC